MGQSGKGFRSGTRSMLKKQHGKKFTVDKFMQEFKEGQRVAVVQDPSSHGGMPHRRYKGKIGVVKAKRGRSYVVDVKLGNKPKQVIAKPEHLKLQK